MTLIIKNNIVLNEKTGKYNNLGVVKKEVKDIIYLNEPLEFIDFTESTASSPWVTIKFKGKNQIWIEQSHRIDLKNHK